jgi:hypothetical protein
VRFEFPAVGHVYDANGDSLIELAHEYRAITHLSIPRVIGKVRVGAWATRLATGGRRDNQPGRAIFPQGGSTITQQIVRRVFLQHQTSQENSYLLRSPGLLPRALSSLVGARNVNMLIRTLVPDEPISVPNGSAGPPKWIFELRRPLQRPHPDAAGARRIEKRRGDSDHRADRNRRRPAIPPTTSSLKP